MPRFFNKYDSEDEANKAWDEREKLHGRQTQELGDLRSTQEKSQAALQEYGNFYQEIGPWLTWWNQNLPWVKQAWAQRQGAAQGNQQFQGQGQQGAQPQQQFQTPPGWENLSPQQQYGLIIQAAGQVANQRAAALFQQQAPRYVKQVEDNLRGGMKNGMDVLWRTFERFVSQPSTLTPEERLNQLRAFHEESLKVSDPSKLNPLDLATEKLALMGERDTFKSRVDALEKERDVAAKKAAASLGAGGGSTRAFTKPKDASERPDRSERMRRAFEDVHTEHGEAGAEQLVGGGTGPLQ